MNAADVVDDIAAGRMEFDAIGTRWVIDTPEPLPLGVEARILAEINDFDVEWSRFRPDSVVAAVAREGGQLPVGIDGEAMMRLYTRLSEATGGAVNPFVGATLEHLGYDPTYRLTPAPGAPEPVPGWKGRFQRTTALLASRAAPFSTSEPWARGGWSTSSSESCAVPGSRASRSTPGAICATSGRGRCGSGSSIRWT